MHRHTATCHCHWELSRSVLEPQMSATVEQNRRILAALAVEIAAVLLYFSVAGINTLIKATGNVPKGTQDKNSRRELTSRPQSSTTYWLPSRLTFQLLFLCSQDPPTKGWYRPHWATRISTYENAQNTRSQTNLIEAVLRLIAKTIHHSSLLCPYFQYMLYKISEKVSGNFHVSISHKLKRGRKENCIILTFCFLQSSQ